MTTPTGAREPHLLAFARHRGTPDPAAGSAPSAPNPSPNPHPDARPDPLAAPRSAAPADLRHAERADRPASGAPPIEDSGRPVNPPGPQAPDPAAVALAALRGRSGADTGTPAPATGAGGWPPERAPGWDADTWRDRLTAWRHDPRAVTALFAAVALVAGIAFYRGAMGASPDAPPSSGGDSGAAASSTATSSSSMPSELVVHVSGAVAGPGVYRLVPGARTADAIAAAGGALPGADANRLNLAAPLADGQRVYVPMPGEVVVADPLPEVGGAAPGGTAASGPLNLNTATATQLESLPGVGPSLAAAIVAERDRRGGFRKVDDLLAVRGIGDKRLADLKPHVVV